MERLSILCFAGTYGLALAGDLARFVVRGATRWYATVALTALGWAVHTAFLGHLVNRADVGMIQRAGGSRLAQQRAGVRRHVGVAAEDLDRQRPMIIPFASPWESSV